MAVGRSKSPLALNSKKSLPKFKTNISLYSNNNKLTTMDKLKHSANNPTSLTSLKPSTKSTLNAKKSLDLNQTTAENLTTAFNNKVANNTEYTVNSSSSSTTPFSINNVSNSNNNNLQLQVNNALNDASSSFNINAKNINLLRPPKISKTANNTTTTTTTTTILKHTSITASAATPGGDNLNDLSNCTIQTKKVNFSIPEGQNLENSCSSTDENVDKHLRQCQQHVAKQDLQTQHFGNATYNHSNIVAKQQQKHIAPEAGNNVYKKHQRQHHGFLNKNIVYNGTYPIDMPLSANLNDYDPEANFTRDGFSNYQACETDSNEDYDEEDEAPEDEYDYDDDYEEDYDDDDNDGDFLYTQDVESVKRTHHHHPHQHHKSLTSSYGILKVKSKSAQKPPQVWSMQELINDPSIPLNYKKMCNEVEQTLQDFEEYIDSKAHKEAKSFKKPKPPVLRTFNIDDPIDAKKNI